MYNRKSVYCDLFFIMKGKQKTVIKSLPLDAFRTLSTLANKVILKIKHNFCCKMFKVHNKKFLSQYLNQRFPLRKLLSKLRFVMKNARQKKLRSTEQASCHEKSSVKIKRKKIKFSSENISLNMHRLPRPISNPRFLFQYPTRLIFQITC